MRYTIKQLEILIPALDITISQYAKDVETVSKVDSVAYRRITETFKKQHMECIELQKTLQAHLDSLYNQEV